MLMYCITWNFDRGLNMTNWQSMILVSKLILSMLTSIDIFVRSSYLIFWGWKFLWIHGFQYVCDKYFTIAKTQYRIVMQDKIFEVTHYSRKPVKAFSLKIFRLYSIFCITMKRAVYKVSLVHSVINWKNSILLQLLPWFSVHSAVLFIITTA